MSNLPFSKAFTICALTLTFCIASFAQGTTTRITGTVYDPSGAPVSGATVSIKRDGLGTPLTAQTAEDGRYVFDLIQAGTYEVTVEKSGFNKFVSTDNAAFINQPLTVNVNLVVGDVNATVTVVGAAEAVQTQTSGNVGSTVDQKSLESLPIVGTRGRNPLDLLNFQPGVVTGGNTGGLVQVHGSRDRAFNFTLDGIDINESTFGGSNTTPLKVNPESIQEFQVVTSNATAELGRSSGAQVTMVTRSGTNDFHGNLFEFYQTPRFNAKSYAETINGSPKGQFVQHIFGGSFGGPVPNFGFGEGTEYRLLKDKLFFFVNVQMLRAYDTLSVTNTVYTQSARAGNFRYMVGRANGNANSVNPIPAVDVNGNPVAPPCGGAVTTNCFATYNANANSPFPIDTTLTGYINEMPLPNNFTTGDGLNTAGFTWGSPQREKQMDFSTKIDYIHNPQNAFYVRYSYGNQNTFGDSVNGGRPKFPNTPRIVDTFRTPRNLAFNWRWSPTPKVTNEFLYGHSRYGFTFDTPERDLNYNFIFLTITDTNLNDSYNARSVKLNQFVDNITFDLSPHTIKAGVNFRLGKHFDDRYFVSSTTIHGRVTLNNSANLFDGTLPGLPSWNFGTAAAGIASNDNTTLRSYLANRVGFVNAVTRAFVSNGATFDPPDTRWFNTAKYDEYDFYIQDNWKIRPNFLLDLGVRWEVKMKPAVDDRPILVPDQPVKLGAPPSNNLRWVEGELFDNAFGLILPSVGFAWDPFKDGKTSIRGNYRMATDRYPTFLFGSSIFQSTPGNNVSQSNTLFGQTGGRYVNVGPILAGLVPAQSPTALAQPPSLSSNSLSVVDPDLTYPQVNTFLVSFQREITKNNVFEFNYIRKHAVHLSGGYNINQVNINATDSRCPGQTFLQAWNLIQTPTAPATMPCLIALFRNASGAPYTIASFRTEFQTDRTGNNGTANSVAATAQTLARRAGSGSLTSAGFDPFFFMRYPQFAGGFNVFDSSDYSNYTGLEFIFKRRFTQGLGFQVAYTWSVSKDNRSFDPTQTTVSTGTVQSATSTPFDIDNRHLNYSWSDFDRRHVFQATWVYELPFGEGRKFKFDNSVANYIISGWQFSGTFLWQSGTPFNVYTGFNTFTNIVGTLANCSGCPRDMGEVVQEAGANYFFNAEQRAMFTSPAAGDLSDLPRNYFISPGYWQPDFSFLRKFRLTERFNLDFRVDMRNAFNHPNLAGPNAVINSTSAPFGRIRESVTNAARRTQFSMKLNF